MVRESQTIVQIIPNFKHIAILNDSPYLPVFCVIIDNLKITDFGLSTVFRHKGKERLLGKCCGTPPYVAPEVGITLKAFN